MTNNNQKPKTLTSEEKQYTVPRSEAEPNASLGKAMAAVLKAKGATQNRTKYECMWQDITIDKPNKSMLSL